MSQVSSIEFDGSTTGPVSNSETFGLPQGPWTLYHLQPGAEARDLWFHFPLPQPTQLFLGPGNARIRPELFAVFVLWSASNPAITLQKVVAFDGTTSIPITSDIPAHGVTSPIPFNGPLTSANSAVEGRTQFGLETSDGVQFGLGVSARFTIARGAGNGTLQFFGAGGRFTTLPSGTPPSS